MFNGLIRFSILLLVCFILVVVAVPIVSAKAPEGYRDIKLGMNKAQVLELMQKSPTHFSYDDMGDQIGEIIRGDDLFRYATYKFDSDGILVEIGLQMREIVGRDRCIEIYNMQTGLNISPSQGCTVDSDVTIEVRENSLIMKKNPLKDTRAAKGSS